MGHKYVEFQFIYRGLESKTSVKTTIIEARGEKLFEGDSKVYLDAVYYWNPVTNTTHLFSHKFTYLKCEKHFFVVNVVLFLCDFMIKPLQYKHATLYYQIVAPGSNLSLCIVMKQNNTVSNKDVLTRPSDGDFLYHRWDLNQWPAPFCRHFSRYATEGL